MNTFVQQNRRVRIAEIVLILIAIMGSVYVGDTVTSSGVFSGSRTVTVELPSGGGIYPGANVTYRGNTVGTVNEVRLVEDGVDLTVSIRNNVDIPVDTAVAVANLSAIGEQYLDFRPYTADGPYLADGDIVPRDVTQVPLRFDHLLANVNDLADLIDLDDIRTLTNELGLAFDSDVDLATIGSQANATHQLFEDLEPTLRSIASNTRSPLNTFDARADQFQASAHNLNLILATLANEDSQLRALIDQGTITIAEALVLLQRIDPLLEPLLSSTHTLGTLAADRDAGFRHWFAWAPDQMVGMAESTRDGSGRTLLVPNPSPVCHYGSEQRSPLSVERHAADTEAKCTTEHPVVQQRGAQYAPRLAE